MWEWQGVLALLAAAWLLQCVGMWIQIRRYKAAFRELSTGWADGWMGAGRGGRFPRAGAIALVVAAPDETIRRVVVIKGRTVFAKAERMPAFEGLPVAAMREALATFPQKAVATAVVAALDQIGVVRARQARQTPPAASPRRSASARAHGPMDAAKGLSTQGS